MKTRFDGSMWIGAGGTVFSPAEMETDHLLNTVKMLKNRPAMIISMVIRDVEAAPDFTPFVPFSENHADLVKKSLFNLTSMTPEEVSNYALNSHLGTLMKNELTRRGVNVENFLNMVESPETL